MSRFVAVTFLYYLITVNYLVHSKSDTLSKTETKAGVDYHYEDVGADEEDYYYDYEDDEDVDWEGEVMGQNGKRVRGLTLLNKDRVEVIREPSVKVLRALTADRDDKKAKLTLEKIRELYEKQLEEEKQTDAHKSLLFTNKDFIRLMREESKHTSDRPGYRVNWISNFDSQTCYK